jgi:hypothetical protein
MEEWRHNSTILNLDTRWRFVVKFHAPAALRLGKEPPVPLFRRLGGPRSSSGCYGEEKYVLPLPGIEPLYLGHLII